MIENKMNGESQKYIKDKYSAIGIREEYHRKGLISYVYLAIIDINIRYNQQNSKIRNIKFFHLIKSLTKQFGLKFCQEVADARRFVFDK